MGFSLPTPPYPPPGAWVPLQVLPSRRALSRAFPASLLSGSNSEGEPEWDKGPENEGEIFDVSLTFFRAPSWLDPNNVGRSNTPVGWKAYSPPISQVPSENEEAIPIPDPGSPSILAGTQNQTHHLREGLNYSGRGSPVRGHPYVIALEGSRQGCAYRYSHQRNLDQSGGWGGEVSDSIAEGSGSGGSHGG